MAFRDQGSGDRVDLNTNDHEKNFKKPFTFSFSGEANSVWHEKFHFLIKNFIAIIIDSYAITRNNTQLQEIVQRDPFLILPSSLQK